MPDIDAFEVPAAKRQRVENAVTGEAQNAPPGSRIFSPFRTVGLVSSTAVPFTSVPLGKTTFQVTTSVGRSLQTYDLRKGLSLTFLSRPQAPENITATYAYRDRIFAAWGGGTAQDASGIWVLKRGRLVGELEKTPTIHQEIQQIFVFGVWIIGCGQRALEVWKSDNYEHYTTISPSEHGGAVFTGHACTMPTFLNKVFVGRQDGNVEIYNVSTGKLVHTVLAPSAATGPVTALCPASALHMLAIAYSNGILRIHDVEQDETVLTLRKSGTEDAVTSISFRSDGQGAGDDGRDDGMMATASIASGDITLWDLNKGGRIAGMLRSAHEMSSMRSTSGINKVEFLQGQPVIISSGMDNAIRSWIFDQTPFSSVPRILHSRSGHAAPINQVQFLPAASDGSDSAGKWLLSAGSDRSLWGFSLRKDAQSSELSQGNIKNRSKKVGHVVNDKPATEELKAPPINAIACSLNRDGGMGGVGGPVWQNARDLSAEETGETGWESIITTHEGDSLARTWFWGRKKAGRWTFETGDRTAATSVAITSCGTFALVGSAGGSLDMFNLQSGLHRQRFPAKLTAAAAKKLKEQQPTAKEMATSTRGHTGAITGVVVDNLNQTVLSSSLDGSLIFWDFLTGKLMHHLHLDSTAPTAMHYNPTSGLVSLACDDLCIRVLDLETKRIVRELWGSVGQIYDHCFSHDGRWIVTCSMDSVIRVFDLASGHLIDAFRTATCTNVAFSSTGEFLATAHTGSIGINIWNNKTLSMHVPIRQIDEESGVIDLTHKALFNASSQIALADSPESEDHMLAIDGASHIDQLDEKLLTLSLIPQTRWQTLLNLESIRERNKPVQPPEKPKAAPFFLGSSLTNGQKGALQSADEEAVQAIEATERSRISKLASLQPTASPFTILLKASADDPTLLLAHLSNLSPSAADVEMRTLSIAEMPGFVRALTAQLRRRKDFELVNTWMAVFLKMHGDFVGEVAELREAVLEWRSVMRSEEARLGELVGYVKGVVGFLRSAR